MAALTSLHLGEHGTYMGAGFDYDYRFADGKHSITVRLDGVVEEDALTIDVDEEFAQKLMAVIDEYNLRKWDGYSKSDKNVLDGSGFGFSARFDDGASIYASGYECYPKGYAEVSGALDGLFVPLYEAIRPNKKKVMTKYFEEVILKDNGRLEKQEISYPYISKGGNIFTLGKCECAGGAAWFPVLGLRTGRTVRIHLSLIPSRNRGTGPTVPERDRCSRPPVSTGAGSLRIGHSAQGDGSAAGTVRSYANVVRGNRHDVSRMLFQGQLIP